MSADPRRHQSPGLIPADPYDRELLLLTVTGTWLPPGRRVRDRAAYGAVLVLLTAALAVIAFTVVALIGAATTPPGAADAHETRPPAATTAPT